MTTEHGRSESSTPRPPLISETLRWLFGLVLSALVAYFTATGALREQIAAIKATQESQFQEVLRSLGRIESDIRELRGRKP